MSFFVFVKDHALSLSSILGINSNGTYASSNDAMTKVLR